MKIALDAMGGDNGPEVTVKGAVESLNELEDIEIYLVGDTDRIEKELKDKSFDSSRISIKHASEVVEMDEATTSAVRKKRNSSIRIAVDTVKSGEADAVLSAGHTGVAMATAFIVFGKAKGVDRPAIATTMPTLNEPFVLLDAGANVDCKPINLLQFAFMGNAYYKTLFNLQSPKIGLLSIGEEDSKGNELTKETFRLLNESGLNFTGNIEGKDIFGGTAHVVVCDGFIGNTVLKVSEGLAEMILSMLKREISGLTSGKIGYFFLKPAFKNFKTKTDYAEYGGAPLLGINGNCIICHGRSSSKAIKNALKVSNRLAKNRINNIISESLLKN